MTLKPLALSVLAALIATPALSLSCAPHEVTDTYQRLNAAEAQYVVVHGRLSFDEGQAPVGDGENPQSTPPDTFIPARITGKSLSKNGFSRIFDAPLTLNLQCIGPWCANASSGQDVLAFLERKPDRLYALALNACGGDGFLNPTAAQLKEAETCFAGGPCAVKYPN